MTEEHKQEQKKTSARPIGHVSEYATLGRKHSEVQISRSPDVQSAGTLDARKSKHPDWKQQTIYLPPELRMWLRVLATQSETEVSEIVRDALLKYKRELESH